MGIPDRGRTKVDGRGGGKWQVETESGEKDFIKKGEKK